MRLLAALTLAAALFVTVDCGGVKPPAAPDTSQLSVKGLADYKKGQIVKALDSLRDAAINSNKVSIELLSDKNTRTVVDAHTSAIHVIQASDAGWSGAVQKALDESLTSLSPAEKANLQPYFDMLKTLLKEIASGPNPVAELRYLGAARHHLVGEVAARAEEPGRAAAH